MGDFCYLALNKGIMNCGEFKKKSFINSRSYGIVLLFLFSVVSFGCSNKIPSYEYGTTIQFGKGGNAEKYQAKGWSDPENGLTWTDGKTAELHMSIAKPKSDITMKATFNPFLVPGKLDRQKIDVMINGNKTGEWDASTGGDYKIIIPKDSLKKGALIVTFDLPSAGSPSNYGTGKDDRLLGISMMTLTFSEAPIYEFGTNIQFGKGGNADKYEITGWSGPEEGFTWTNGKTAELSMTVKEPKSDVVLKAAFNPLVVSGRLDKQKIVILINGSKAGEWEASSGGDYKLTIPKDSLKDSVKITFELPNATSPATIGVNKDTRVLGIALSSFSLSESK